MWLKSSLLVLTYLSFAQAETVLGVYIVHRHGDRTAKSLGNVKLTALGTDEVFSSGTYYRDKYVATNASAAIRRLQPDVANTAQLAVSAPRDAVLQNSASAFLQGLYPPAGAAAAQQLANGSTVEAPLGGYQYVPVNAVSSSSAAAGSANAESSTWLQGNSGCAKAIVSSDEYFASSAYAQTLAESKAFYQGLVPVINGTFGSSYASFKNAYTIFDLINVATIHNATIPAGALLTPQVLDELRWRANTHEFNLAYNASDPIRAVAGMTLAGQILTSLAATLATATTTNGSVAPLFSAQFGAYASFLSFFGLAQLPAVSDDFTGIVGYAASMAFELVTNATTAYPEPADVHVRFLFANASAGQAEPRPYPLFGRAETVLPWVDFASEMAKFAIEDTPAWCEACGNSTEFCAAAGSETGASSSGGHGDSRVGTETGGRSSMSLPVAGAIGALVTLVVVLGIEALVYFFLGLTVYTPSALRNFPSRRDIDGHPRQDWPKM